MIDITKFAPIHFAAWLVTLTAAVLLGFDANADDSVIPFPAEITKFHPIDANPVFQGRGKGHWDEHIRERGWILRDEKTWHMWYTGFEGGGGNNGSNLKLGYATSSDGLRWKRFAGNPVYDEHWVEDMMVIKHQGKYYMFAEGKYDIAQLLTSTDGIHWKRIGPLDIRSTSGRPISDGPRGTPAAWLEKGTWYLYYERRDLGIWLATSKDLKVWTNYRDDPVLELGPGAYDLRQVAFNQIVKYEGIYYAYYHGSGAGDLASLWTTNVAASRDLIHWTKYKGNPLLPTKDNKSSGILVHDGKQFRLYTMHDKVHVHFPGSGRSSSLRSQVHPARTLGQFAEEFPAGKGHMRPLGDEGWQARFIAFRDLVLAGRSAVPALIKALDSETTELRILAAQSLAFIDDDQGMARLRVALKDDNSASVRLYVADALGLRGGDENAALLERVQTSDRNGDVRSHCRYALEREKKKIGKGVVKNVRDELADFNSRGVASARLGELAPDFELSTHDLGRVSLSSYRGKKVVVLIFIYGDT